MSQLATPPRTNGELTIKDLLAKDNIKQQIARALPRLCTADRFIRVALTALLRSPDLAKCTQESFMKCMLDLSAMGLEPDGRRAHLIPFKNRSKNITECTLIVDYKGLAELAYRSGVISYMHADVIREGDIFCFSKGELKEHVPWFLRRDEEKPAEAGNIFAVYSLTRMKDGSEKTDVLALSEVMSIRDNSQGWKAFKNGYSKSCPWDPANPVSEQEMMKKTAFRRQTKWLPLSPEIRDAIEIDDEPELTPVRGTIAASPLNERLTNLPSGTADDAPLAEGELPPETNGNGQAADTANLVVELKEAMFDFLGTDAKATAKHLKAEFGVEGFDKVGKLEAERISQGIKSIKAKLEILREEGGE